MPSLIDSKALRERREALRLDMIAINQKAVDEDRDLTEDEQAKWNAMDAESARLKEQHDREERLHDLERSANDVQDPALLEAMNRRGVQDTDQRAIDDDAESRDEHEMFHRMTRGLTPAMRTIHFEVQSQASKMALPESVRKILAEERALTTQTDSSGKYTIPEGFSNALEQSMLHFGSVESMATVLNTPTGNDLPWPTVDDTSNEGEIISENSSANEQDVTFGVVNFNAYKISSKMIKVPSELIQDSFFEIGSLLGRLLGERIARYKNRLCTTGTGTSQHNGVLTASTAGRTASTESGITYVDMNELIGSVDWAYAGRDRASLMFHQSTLTSLKGLLDGDSRPLWKTGVSVREPDTWDGYRYSINNHMPEIAGANKTVLFGDFSKYMIRNVTGISIRRLDERYAELDQVAFLGWMRSDADLLDAGTDPIKHLVHPS